MIYLLATNNPGKAKEIKPMFEKAGLKLISLADLGLFFEAKEDGATFVANAMQKARETAAFLRQNTEKISDLLALENQALGADAGYLSCDDIAVLADDSGLVIDALDGAPGVDSALFMGRETPYAEKCQAILDKLAAVPDDMRAARFVCTLVCLIPAEPLGFTTLVAEGTIEGCIAYDPAGQGGFGYDPIFHYPPLNKTLAQLTKEEKNQVSHRGQAIQKMIGLITNAEANTNTSDK